MQKTRRKRGGLAFPRPEEIPDELPEHEFDARHYQQDVFTARHGGKVQATGDVRAGCNGWAGDGPCKRFMLIWHRRAGKDRTGLELIREESQKRVGSYWHLYPIHKQAKTAIWNGVDPGTDTRLLDLMFPPAMVVDQNEQDMFKRFRNGSTYQLLGSDYYDRLVGSNTVGVLFTEWALSDPRAWPYIMPILLENGGWAAFITTYRGRNHAYQMAKRLYTSKDWYVDVRPITHTRRANGNLVVTPEDVERERESLIAIHGRARADALIREEMYCDPMASLPGSVYGGTVAKMLEQGRA